LRFLPEKVRVRRADSLRRDLNYSHVRASLARPTFSQRDCGGTANQATNCGASFLLQRPMKAS